MILLLTFYEEENGVIRFARIRHISLSVCYLAYTSTYVLGENRSGFSLPKNR